MARGGKKPKKRRIVGGVDTHADTHHAAVELMNGGRVADAQFPATADGYAQLLVWMRSYGRLHAVGVEGTGSYGAGLARYLRGQSVHVVEVNRPDRRQRRNRGKSDPLDAYAAADAVLAGRARALPKGGDGIAESIRAVHLARSGAIKARTACLNELRSLLVTAPAELRERMAGMSAQALTAACARLRPAADLADPVQGTKLALRSLAHRYQALTTEIEELDAHLAALVAQARPKLLAVHGVGPETAAQLLITCGDNPTDSPPQRPSPPCAEPPASESDRLTRQYRRGGLSRTGRRLLRRLPVHYCASPIASWTAAPIFTMTSTTTMTATGIAQRPKPSRTATRTTSGGKPPVRNTNLWCRTRGGARLPD